MFDSDEKPVSKWGGLMKSCRAKLYADGILWIQDTIGGEVVECSILDVSSVTLITGGLGKSRVQLNGHGTVLGTTKALPVSWAQDLKRWIEECRSIVPDTEEEDLPADEEAPVQASPVQMLKDLKELFDLGIITEVEYEEKRKKNLALL